MRTAIILTAILSTIGAAQAQVTAVVTDGLRPFAEGVLQSYHVQAGGRTICTDPYVIGRYISCTDSVRAAGQTWVAESRKKVWIETNGILGGMVVIDANGRTICDDPMVWNQFRGPTSYIQCDR